jgi:MFS family permease
MITFMYIFSGVLLILVGALFAAGRLNPLTQTLGLTAMFFFASAGASSAYLTVSEIFPLEIRAMSIALSYAIGTAIGGTAAPALFGYLVGTGNSTLVFYGYLVAAFLLIAGGVAAAFWAVDAEKKPLEAIAQPLSAAG